MMTIHKYKLEITDRQTLVMPAGAHALSAGIDPQGAMCLWALVDDTAPYQDRVVAICGTGRPVPQGFRFVGTAVSAPFVWHILLQ